ncbi:hypothetical protein Poli38472_009791 [Pythium oligandrum]|uniref:RING-type domain-containing protein n=1 Tax=Pythium oligandrum TaxID=41045 RepID=A0A8K1CFY0_PYTOL|nr:hypothetical protein Poli38472_009791 [Pythium oligandrum]|eukprot:TMW62298.1 hypothetical protein Poli38472_009791 [Pythium oligandrum]
MADPLDLEAQHAVATTTSTAPDTHPDAMCICGEPAGHEFLIECHYCSNWFHGKCMNVSELDAMAIIKFACLVCSKQGNDTIKYQGNNGMIGELDDLTYAPLPIQRQFAAYTADDYSNGMVPSGFSQTAHRKNTEVFRRSLRAALYARSGVRMIASQELNASYFKYNRFQEPLLVVDGSWSVAGLGKPMPVIGIQDIGALLAANSCTVRSVDIGSQEGFQLSTTGWNARLANPSPESPLNAQFRVLETGFRQEVAAPVAVTEIDWHYVLPSSNGTNARVPNPEIYGTLCGAGTFHDFTVSPDTKSTWISVSNGEISVFLIEPTTGNVRAFRDWKSSTREPPAAVFLAERVEQCIKCDVKSMATLVIPSGWIYAIYAEHGGSYFSGFFGNTVTLTTQLDVWRELEEDAQIARQWHDLSFPHGWSSLASPALSPTPPFNAQLWSAVCHYINELAHMDNNLRVHPMEREELRRVLPRLRMWSQSPRAITRQDNVSWLPSSQQDAENLLDQLEQALGPEDAHATSNGTNGISSKMTMLSSLSNGNDASYLYQNEVMDSVTHGPEDDMWNGASPTPFQQSTNGSTPTTNQGTSQGMWDYASYHQQQHNHALDAMVNSSYFHSQLTDNSSFATTLQHNPYAQTQQASNTFGAFLDAGGSSSTANSSLGLTQSGLSLVGVGADVDGQMRHRASCHRCGNLRKKNVRCPKCPHIFCQKCAEKMLEEHGEGVFVEGCPVCKELCCCGKNRSMMCPRKFHCYKKCPATKRPSA